MQGVRVRKTQGFDQSLVFIDDSLEKTNKICIIKKIYRLKGSGDSDFWLKNKFYRKNSYAMNFNFFFFV